MARALRLTNHRSPQRIDGAAMYTQLRKDVVAAGILKRSYRYYSLLTLFVLAGFFGSVIGLFQVQLIPLVVFWSFMVGFFGVQIGGLMHDAGHRAVFDSTENNDRYGHFVGSFVSMGFSSWKYRHNMHHAHTNERDVDPDIIDAPFLSFTRERFQQKKGIWKKLARHQVFFYYPLLLLFNIGLRSYGMRYFKKREHILEMTIYYLGMFAWFVLPLFLFPFWKAITFLLVSNIVMGFYFLNILASNHKAMPKLEKGRNISFLEQQIMTSCNVSSNGFGDFLYMGLNYQIEHHLFPNCPRNKLHKITPYVLDLCKKMDLEYTRVDFVKSHKMILDELQEIAAPKKN